MSEAAATEPRRTAVLRSPILQAGAEAAAFAMMAFAASGYVLVIQREEVARSFAEDWLRQRGIESSFDIESIDAGAFTGSMRVGPRGNPVFQADRVEVAYDLTTPWAGGPFKLSTRAIRVVRPRLRVTFDGRKFSAGPLDPLISDFLKRPKTDEPGPAVLIEDSLTTIVTKQGNVRLAGDAALDDGKLLRFDGRLLPTRLKGEDFTAASSGGTLRLRKVGETLSTDLRLDVNDLTTAGLDLDGGEAAVEGTIPYPDPKTQALAGPARLHAAISAGRARAGEASASRLAANAVLNGTLAGSPANAVFSGRMNGSASVAALNAGELKAEGMRGVFSSNSVSLGRTATAFPFATRLNARRLTAQGYVFDAASVDANGRFRAGKGGYVLTADGSASGSSGLPAARARRIAAAVPVLSGDPAQERAIASFLQRFNARASRISLTARNGDVDVALTGPVTLHSPSGGEAILTPRGRFALLGGKPGGFDIATRGGGLPDLRASVSSWSYRPGAIDARLAIKGSLNAPPARKAVVDAEGVLRVRGPRTTFTLTRCGTARAELVDFGEVDLTDASATVCPSGGPLVTASGGNWQVRGRFENGKAAIPIWKVAGADAAGSFDVGGRGDMDRASIKLAALRLSDTEEAKRFNPVRASGGATLANGVWQGAFPIATDANRPVGTFNLTHNVASGRGEGRIDASGMVFAKEGLQPVEILPVAEMVRDAEGPAGFIGTLTWGPEGVTSSGDLATPGLNFRSPAGQVTGLKTAIHFTSLAPLVTAPDQTATIEQLAAITPLENVQAQFDLVADAINLDRATATLAGGSVELEPLTAPLASDRTIKGVLNLKRIDVGKLVADTSLADRIVVKAIVDGRLPFEMGPEGLRFREGRLVAVEPGRISISRTVLSNVKAEGEPAANPMDATPPAEEFNAVQDFAYQAMENLSFEVLEADVDSAEAGRLRVVFRIKGEHDPAVAEEARISIQEAMSGGAFKRRIPLPKGTPVNLTLDTSLNFDELLAAWRRGWRDAAEP
jgi:hypothetical protein